MKSTGRPTILSVAERAGVSRAAVSKVLRNQYGVSPQLRAKVEQAVEELKYRPLASARALRGRGHAIGILMAEIANPFFPEILDGVAQALDATDYQTFLGIGHFQELQQERMIETMLDRQMDGLIMIAPRLSYEVLLRFVDDIPVVVIGYSHPGATGFNSVNSEDAVGTEMVIRHFHAQGHKRIAMLTADLVHDVEQVGSARLNGYYAAMRKLRLGKYINVCPAPLYGRSAPQSVIDLLRSEDRPTAVFAMSDGFAMHLFNAAAELGLRIPEDLAIAGYDDSWVAELAPLSLSSVQQSGVKLGTNAVRLLMERIEGRQEAVHLQLPPTLIVRKSSVGSAPNYRLG